MTFFRPLFFRLSLLSLLVSLTLVAADFTEFAGNRRPGILSQPEVAEGPDARAVNRVEEIEELHRRQEPEAGEVRVDELPSADAI